MAEIRRLVVDVLKPHEPPMIQLTQELADLEGVEGVNSSLLEVDEEVKNVKLTMEGRISDQEVRSVIEGSGASIHSIDEVAAGERLVDKINTPQD
ncbi:MAG: DUF211 domain-containing protein [Candidatus Nanohaloarchaea archaeon]